MGVAGLWEILRPAGKTRSLTELSVAEGFEANPDGVRGFRLGIDASIWFFHAEYGKEGENPVLRTLFFRCATLMHSPFLPLFVFDGPKRPDVKRGKKINRTSHKLIPGMKTIVESFGFEWRTAPGEAEAELAYLNRIGVIDGILSDDVDNFLFGAVTVIRNPSNTLSGNRANPVLNAAGKDDKNHTKVYRLSDITAHPDIRLTRGGMILIGLMSGGDYQQGGLSRCGTVISHGLAKCGFGDTLYRAANDLNREDLQMFLSRWRHDVCHELRTNSQGHIGKKHTALANSIPETFPDIDILISYTNPITSESMGKAKNNLQLTWSKEPDLGKLAATCELYFEWGYKEAIIKRFRSVIWHSATLRVLRRAVLDLDARRIAPPDVVPATPRKPKHPSPTSVGTPSKMIAKHFSSFTLGELKGYISDSEDDENERLIVKIHSSRSHVSTDGILEYRLEIAPAQFVRIAESGIKGIRQPEGPDEWASGDELDGGKELPPDPDSHMRVWMPASMVSLVEPRLVEDFEAVRRQKQQKASAKGRVKAGGKSKALATITEQTTTRPTSKRVTKGKPETSRSVTAVDVHHHLEPGMLKEAPTERLVRDLTKRAAIAQGMGSCGNLKNFFPSTKSSTTIRDKLNPSLDPRHASHGRGFSASDADGNSVPKRNLTAPSRSSTDEPPVSGYLEPSGFGIQGEPVRPKESVLQSSGVSSCDDEFLGDDPFDDAARSRTRHKVLRSSPEPDSTDSPPPKSPRMTSKHTSPRSTRSKYQGGSINKDPHRMNNSYSPSPLIPFIRPQMHATTRKTSQTPAYQLRTINISSDSEEGDEPITKVPPLELARARAKGNTRSGIPNQTSFKGYTNLTQPIRKQPNLKNAVHQDIIDLT